MRILTPYYYIRGWMIYKIYAPGTFVYDRRYRSYFRIIDKNIIVQIGSVQLVNISNVESGKYLDPIICF